MIRLFITLAITTIGCLTGYGQQTVKSISNYIETAKANSPLLKDYRNQLQIGQAELQQLKAMHTRSFSYQSLSEKVGRPFSNGMSRKPCV